ncbi:unnamed protein product [Somion occarium]|uniref:Zn(2)-C6 fungal-type domain-containing protein n=1 Tax=Somion occarium TaxID=3059160 RepID=A0ABP1DG50_9APHY
MRVMNFNVGSDRTSSPSSFTSTSRPSSPALSVEDFLSSMASPSDVRVTPDEVSSAVSSGTVSPQKLFMQPDPYLVPAGHTVRYAQSHPDDAFSLAQAQMQRAMMLQALAAQAGHPPQTFPIPPTLSMPILSNPLLDQRAGIMAFPTSGSRKSVRALMRKEGHPRIRVEQACEKCRKRKVKCTGARPTCARCDNRGITCVYAPEKETASFRSLRGVEKSRMSRSNRSPLYHTGVGLAGLQHAQYFDSVHALAAAQYFAYSGSPGTVLPNIAVASEESLQTPMPLQRPTGGSRGGSLLNLLNPMPLPPGLAMMMNNTGGTTSAASMQFHGGPNDPAPHQPLDASSFATSDSQPPLFMTVGNSMSSSSSSPPVSVRSSPAVWPAEPPLLSATNSLSISRLSSSSLSESVSSSIGEHQGVGLEQPAPQTGINGDMIWMESRSNVSSDSDNSSLVAISEVQHGSESNTSNESFSSSVATSSYSSEPPANVSTTSAAELEALLANLLTHSNESDVALTSNLADKSDIPSALSNAPSQESSLSKAVRAALGDIPPPVIASSGTFHHLAFTGGLAPSNSLSDMNLPEPGSLTGSEEMDVFEELNQSGALYVNASIDSLFGFPSPYAELDSLRPQTDTSLPVEDLEGYPLLSCTRTSSATTADSELLPTPTEDTALMGEWLDLDENGKNERRASTNMLKAQEMDPVLVNEDMMLVDVE